MDAFQAICACILGLAQRHVQNCRFPEASTASAKQGIGALKSLERGKGGKKDVTRMCMFSIVFLIT